MIQKQREMLEAAGVVVAAENSEIHFGVGNLSRMEFEQHAEIRAGRFDIEKIGAFSYLGGGTTIIRNVLSIGRFCSIAPNLVVGPVEHPTDELSTHYLFQGMWKKNSLAKEFYTKNRSVIEYSHNRYIQKFGDAASKVVIGSDVWIGEGVFIRRGVKIGDGAVIGARSVITRDVLPYEIVAGVPGRHIRYRFSPIIVGRLMSLEWWKYGLSALDNVDFTNVDVAVNQIGDNIMNGVAVPFSPKVVVVNETP